MSESKSVALAYPRLCLAYFLQFAVWGSYGFALGGFALNGLKFSGSQMGWIGAAIPIGALVAPFVGRIADKYMSAQYVLSILQFVCAGLLFFVGTMTAQNADGAYTAQFWPMMTALVMVGVFYMPTIPLINSIVFANVPNRDNAPRVFMFGTIGWIAIVLFIQAFFGAGDNNQFFFVGSGCSLLLAVYALTLPNTPPQAANEEQSGKKSTSMYELLLQPSVAVFAFTILIAGIAACGLFFTTCFAMLGQRGYPGGLALTTLNQFSEVLFMALLPIFAVRCGLKNVILIGIAAWFSRYICFMFPAFELALLGLILHGFCYSFLYVGSYQYGDKIASPEMKASVQSLIGFILLGVGQIVGSVMAGQLVEWNPPVVEKVTLGDNVIFKLPAWSDPAAASSAWNKLDLAQYVKSQEKKAEAAKAADAQIDFGSIAKDGVIDAQLINGLTDGIKSKDGSAVLSKEQLTSLFTQVQSKLTGQDVKPEEIKLDRQQYLQAQTNDWAKIFMVPAVMMAVAFIVFLLFGKNPKDVQEEEQAVAAAN